MAKITREKLKNLFSDGKLPIGQDFANWLDSFYHKDDEIDISKVDGLIKEMDELKKNLEDTDINVGTLGQIKEDKTDADKRFGDLNTAVMNLQNTKEDQADATNKYNDLNNRKEEKAEADKKFGDLDTAITNLQNTKEDQADAEAKYKDLNDRKEDKAEADKKIGDLNAAITNLQNTKEDQADADVKFNYLDVHKQEQKDMVNYLRIDPNGLQDNDIAIHEGGQWVRKQASEISTINPLTLQQNGQTIGTFDGRSPATVNVDAPKTIEATSANINKHIEQDVELTGEEYCKKYQSIQSGSTVVKGSFSYSNNEIIKSPYGKFNTASATSLIAGKDPINGYQALFMVGENATDVNPLVKELLLLDIKPNTYLSGWTRMLNDHNFNEYAPKKDGTGASGTWNININGSSSNAKLLEVADTRATNPNPIDYPKQTFSMDFKANSAIGLSDGMYSGVMSIFPWTDTSGGNVKQLAFTDNNIYFRNGNDKGWFPWYKIISEFNFNDFAPKKDGTGASGTWKVDINNNQVTTNGLQCNGNGSIKGLNVDGDMIISKSCTCKDQLTTQSLQVGGDTVVPNNVYINNGQVKAPKGFFETSDATLKTNVRDIDVSYGKDIHFVEFDRTDTKHHGYGVIAQEVEQLYPTVVVTDEQSGIKQVNYNEVYAIKLAYLERELAELRKEVKLLKQLKN